MLWTILVLIAALVACRVCVWRRDRLVYLSQWREGDQGLRSEWSADDWHTRANAFWMVAQTCVAVLVGLGFAWTFGLPWQHGVPLMPLVLIGLAVLTARSSYRPVVGYQRGSARNSRVEPKTAPTKTVDEPDQFAVSLADRPMPGLPGKQRVDPAKLGDIIPTTRGPLPQKKS